MYSFVSIIFSLFLTLSWISTAAYAHSKPTGKILFFNQLLKSDPIIEKYYYSVLPYEFLALEGALYLHDDDLSIRTPRSGTIDLNLYFNEAIFLKKIDISWESSHHTRPAVKRVTLKQIQESLTSTANSSKLSLYIDAAQSRTLFDQQNRVTFVIEPAKGVENLKLKVEAFGLNRNAIFMIIRHLLHTRDNTLLNEDLLRSLYLNGFTAILPLFKYEEYPQLFLPKDSLFFLPLDTDFSTEFRTTKSLLKAGKYPSKEGIKPLPDIQKDKEKFLYIDQKKIRFLRLKDPHESIEIQKIDLAK